MLKAAANAKMVKKTITLNNGVEMPMVGFGTGDERAYEKYREQKPS